MSQVISNIFTIEKDTFKNTDFVNKFEKEVAPPTFNNPGNTLLENAKKILHTCKGYERLTFNEIYLTLSNFKDNHYNLMNHRHLVVLYDNTTKEYKYLTPTGDVYITSEVQLIKIIHNVPYPRKITFSYVPLLAEETIISFSLLSQVLYNFYIDEPTSLLKKHLKTTIEIDSSSEYALCFYLFNIYSKLEFLISEHNYWKYIFLDQDVYNVSKRIEKSYNCFFDESKLNILKSSTEEQLISLINKLGIDKSVADSKESLLNYLTHNDDYYPSVNMHIMDLLGHTDITAILGLLNKLELISSVQKSRSLPITKTISPIGDIGKGLESIYNLSNKVLLRGSYEDLFFKIFADTSYNKKYCKLCSDSGLITALLKEKLDDEDMIDLYSLYVENYIKAISLGCKSSNDILDYFKINLGTLVNETDIDTIKDIYEKDLSDVGDTIDNFNNVKCRNISPRLLNHIDLTPISIAVYEKKRYIIKTLIKEIDLYCKDFNKKNKSKIDIHYFDESSICLLSDEEAVDTAFDTLTRIMPIVFSKFCPKVSPTCYIEIIKN